MLSVVQYLSLKKSDYMYKAMRVWKEELTEYYKRWDYTKKLKKNGVFVLHNLVSRNQDF